MILKIILIQLFCRTIKTLIAQFRRKLDTVLSFDGKNLKSSFLTQKIRLMSNLVKFRFECDLCDLANWKNSKSSKFHEFGSLIGIFKTCVL